MPSKLKSPPGQSVAPRSVVVVEVHVAVLVGVAGNAEPAVGLELDDRAELERPADGPADAHRVAGGRLEAQLDVLVVRVGVERLAHL